MGDYGNIQMDNASSTMAPQPTASSSVPSSSSGQISGGRGKRKIGLIILVGIILVVVVGAFFYFFNPFAIRGSVGINP